MDVASYRDACSASEASCSAARPMPLQWTMENNSGRQGRHGGPGQRRNNEVHIQLKLKQTDAKILQAIEEALQRVEAE